MIAETLLVCWLIACVFVPLVLLLTREPPVEVRRVTNALVMQRASLVARDALSPDEVVWRNRCAVFDRIPLDVWPLETEEVAA